MRALPTPVALPWQRSLNCSKAHATSTRGRLVIVRRGQAQVLHQITENIAAVLCIIHILNINAYALKALGY